MPNVDSVLVAFERSSDVVTSPQWPELSRLVHGAFAHRRKRLDNSLALAGQENSAPATGFYELKFPQQPQRPARLRFASVSW